MKKMKYESNEQLNQDILWKENRHKISITSVPHKVSQSLNDEKLFMRNPFQWLIYQPWALCLKLWNADHQLVKTYFDNMGGGGGSHTLSIFCDILYDKNIT